MTYLEAGGVFLLGQLFDKSATTTLWSEPVDAILRDLSGTYHGWHPLVVFTNRDGFPRCVGCECCGME